MTSAPERIETFGAEYVRADLVPQWLPIETAPKDGTQFLFNAPQMDCGLSIGEFNAGRLCSAFDGKVLGDWVTPPTHWMPLPAAPEGMA